MKQTRSDNATSPDPVPEPEVQSLIEAARRGVRRALTRHKARGHPIVVWRDGKIVHLAPEDIQV